MASVADSPVFVIATVTPWCPPTASSPGPAGTDCFDDQFARTLAASYASSADLGEAFSAARSIGTKVDPDSWYDGWISLARSVDRAATTERAVGHVVSARDASLRASEYYRQAFFFIRHLLDDERLQKAYADHVRT